MRARRGKGLLMAAVAAAIAVCAATALAADVAFRDNFDDATLSDGWSIHQDDPSRHTLTARPGFLRIYSQRGVVSDEVIVENLFLREVSGDFILDTLLYFDPQTTQQFGGMVVYLDDSHAVTIGLIFAAGERGEFRGVVMVSAGGDDSGSLQRPAAARYDETTTPNPAKVYLRLLRSGGQFVGAYSADGRLFTDVGTQVNDLPPTVHVGIGAFVADIAGCGAPCDISIPADFDYFQVSTLGSGPSDDPPVSVLLESVAISGPDAFVGGDAASFTAVAEFSDFSSEDVTDGTEWMVAPPEMGTIEAGEFSAADVETTQQATIVATFTQLTSGGTVTKTAAKVVRILADRPPGLAGLCGLGLSGVLPFLGWTYLLLHGRRRAGSSRARSAYRTPG